MSSRRAALVLACTALSGGVLGACGGGDSFVDSVPKSTPDLTVPSNGAGLPPVQSTSTTSTTATTTTPAAGATTTPASPTQATPTPQTGGTPSGGTATPTTQTTTPSSGGTPAGGFTDFCKQNPGACGQ